MTSRNGPPPVVNAANTCRKMGSKINQRTSKAAAHTKPAMNEFGVGRRDGRYKKPEPDDEGGITKMS